MFEIKPKVLMPRIVGIRISGEAYSWLQKMSRDSKTTVSEVCRQLIDSLIYVKSNKRGGKKNGRKES